MRGLRWLSLVVSLWNLQAARAPGSETRTFYTSSHGLPHEEVLALAASADAVYAGTGRGLAHWRNGKWVAVPGADTEPVRAVAVRGEEIWFTQGAWLMRLRGGKVQRVAPLKDTVVEPRSLAAAPGGIFIGGDRGCFEFAAARLSKITALDELLGPDRRIRQVAAGPRGQIAVAAASGLFLREPGGAWRALYPTDGARSWAPRDVRGVAFDRTGRLWFASAQGVGRFDGQSWRLFTGEDGLPYDDFTAAAAGPDGEIWFGTRIGAVRYDGDNWEYRQGLRWLPDDEVLAIAVQSAGRTWFGTRRGAALIERRPMTLAAKAAYFESEIDKRHRRTPYGYVDSVILTRPGDLSKWTQRDSDNDGLWTSMYGAGECFAYAATGSELARRRARAAFEALRFLQTVTQGGRPPAQPGFVARTVLPASGPDPNRTHYTRQRDEHIRATRDRLWKVIVPRWPLSADGQWYWKCDTSSDELDGHFFFYAQYHDLVASTEEEKREVRTVVAAIADHLLRNNFRLVDHDGRPTRWAVFHPEALNHDKHWWVERGLNSLSILSYLRTAEHITGARRYGDAAARLIRDHGYHINTLVPKIMTGPGSGNQSDDEMAFMNYYNLLRYEKDPALRELFAYSLYNYWQMEKYERNPLFAFIYAASCKNMTFTDAFRSRDLSLRAGEGLEDALDTLARFPLDRVNWAFRNSHRKDVVLLPAHTSDGDGAVVRGCLRDGRVLPVDERFFEHWNHDPWRLDSSGDGRLLADGAAFLLPYYMGLYHGFVSPQQ